MMNIYKAIIPCAGLGTRFLPITKTIPKEMLPLLDKPALQYSIEEGLKAGLKNFIMVTNKNKKTIEDHFDDYVEFEEILKSKNKECLLSSLGKISDLADFTYVRQREPLGLGHAIWSARHAIGKEYVAILLPDDVFMGSTSGIAQLMKVAMQEKCNIVAVQEMPIEEISRYGVIAIKKQFSPNLFQVKSLIEKPTPTEAPTNLAIVGRYILSPSIFSALEATQVGAGNELQLTDAIHHLLSNGEKVFAYKIQGTRYDVGTPLEWLKTNIILGLKHPAYCEELHSFLHSIDRERVMMEGQVEALSKKQKETIL